MRSPSRWTTRQSVLTTIRGDGRPQLSNVFHHVFDDGIIRISITAGRAKYRNLLREPWAALHVTSDDFFAYVVLEGTVELAPVPTRPDDPTVDELVLHYRAVVGEHEDWDAFRDGDGHRTSLGRPPHARPRLRHAGPPPRSGS